MRNVRDKQEMMKKRIFRNKKGRNEGRIIIIQEVTETVHMLENDKAAGHDNARVGTWEKTDLKCCPKCTIKYWGETPKHWEMEMVTTLFKKREITIIVEELPYWVLFVVLKVYERHVEEKVGEMLDKQLEESQSGFRKGKSCQNHAFTLKRISEKFTYMTKNLQGFRRHTKSFWSRSKKAIWQNLK